MSEHHVPAVDECRVVRARRRERVARESEHLAGCGNEHTPAAGIRGRREPLQADPRSAAGTARAVALVRAAGAARAGAAAVARKRFALVTRARAPEGKSGGAENERRYLALLHHQPLLSWDSSCEPRDSENRLPRERVERPSRAKV